MLEIRELTGSNAPSGVLEIVPRRFGDDRGFFAETWNKERFEQAGVANEWCQDNQSLSAEPGTLRGLHYQTPPFAQAKLVRVLRGSVFDVAVDIRRGSPTFGRWVSLTLSADSFNQILVPRGFAHGFLTLEPDTMVLYKVDAPYSGESDRSIRWNDPDIGIDWPLGRDGVPNAPVLSAKDAEAPRMTGADIPFRYNDEA